MGKAFSKARQRTSRKRMPLLSWSAMVVFWHSVHGPPKRAPELWVPGRVSRWTGVASAMADSQSSAAGSRGGAAAVAVAVPPTAVTSPAVDSAAAPLRNPRRSIRVLPSLACPCHAGRHRSTNEGEGLWTAAESAIQSRKSLESPIQPESWGAVRASRGA
ncbi:hypothetical protein GCM10017744_031070 [Streptomyces antimycoticus]